MANSVLITGGAGYIGGHVARLLGQRGESLIILDDLSTGHLDNVRFGQIVIGDAGNAALLDDLLSRHAIDTVLHFAARTSVPESVQRPLDYYETNTCVTQTLLGACARAGVRHFMFSSTAAVYALPALDRPASEHSPTEPHNPYGRSKLMAEWMVRDVCAATTMRHAILRYFNVAGSAPGGGIGPRGPQAGQLIKVACEAALGRRPFVEVFGTDYDTPDGTGVRDYIHVEDLASAHVLALDYLRMGGASVTLNCGYGTGRSVREVLAAVAMASGQVIRTVNRPRRPGDLPLMVADPARLRGLLHWTPRYADLDLIVGSALEWERNLPASTVHLAQRSG
ncbi:MAG TPA: UDP-glucose 4-epimerase GalE [Candidatus Macondimonas sp.]|nr:UDP-glucose 4-epimerase GalE [Candidatus Macondimonas sp.]